MTQEGEVPENAYASTEIDKVAVERRFPWWSTGYYWLAWCIFLGQGVLLIGKLPVLGRTVVVVFCAAFLPMAVCGLCAGVIWLVWRRRAFRHWFYLLLMWFHVVLGFFLVLGMMAQWAQAFWSR